VSHNGPAGLLQRAGLRYVPYPDASFLSNNPGVKHGPVAAAWVPGRPAEHDQPAALEHLRAWRLAASLRRRTPFRIHSSTASSGRQTQYSPPNYLWSAKWYDDRKGPYHLIYSYWNPSMNGGAGGYSYISESTTTPLVGGWNVVKRSFTYMSNGQQVYPAGHPARVRREHGSTPSFRPIRARC